jgi:hypothetical protein
MHCVLSRPILEKSGIFFVDGGFNKAEFPEIPRKPGTADYSHAIRHVERRTPYLDSVDEVFFKWVFKIKPGILCYF